MSGDPLDRLRAADPLGGELPEALSGPPALPPQRTRWSRDRILLAANAVLMTTVLLHGVDHLLQDRGIGALSFQVLLGGFSLSLAAGASMYAAWRRHGRAPLLALLAGPWVALAVVAGHFLPHWSAFSDPYADAGLGFVSYAIALATAVDGLILAAVAAWTLRLRREHR